MVNVFSANVEGRPDVVCFKRLAGYLINEQRYLSRRKNADEEAQRIIQLAAKIILGDIRAKQFDNINYPTSEDITNLVGWNKWIPESLKQFLNIIIKSSVKQISIGQCIVFAARPRTSITPIPFGLEVEMDHVFVSKWLIAELTRLGFSICYKEVSKYKQSVVQYDNIIDALSKSMPETFTQWVADNVDHNVATLDGKGTFHGMGIINVTSGSFSTELSPVRRHQLMKVTEVAQNKGIPILSFVRTESSGISSLTYKPLVELQFPYTLPNYMSLDLLRHATYFFKSYSPCWSGYMQNTTEGNHPGKSRITMLPIIDLYPSDDTCLYSTLMFVIDQAARVNITTPCITLDQPLWIKALEIVKLKSLNVVCRLGGFHTLMSFLGIIGAVMKGSSLSVHMTSGKAVARALRGHYLVETALMIKLLSPVVPKDEKITDKVSLDGEADAAAAADLIEDGQYLLFCYPYAAEIL